MSYARSLLIVAVVWACALPALGDWNVGDPYKMHYPQLPDLTPFPIRTGIDVLDSQQQSYGNMWKILADDWKCTETGAVSDVHLWGSWWLQPGGPALPDPGAVFKLSIHSNLDGPPSTPGPELWSAIFQPGAYTARLAAQDPSDIGHFWDPNPNAPYGNGVLGDVLTVWQYNFTDIPSPFIQRAGTVYWLDVQVLSPNGECFGWRSTDPSVTPHFMDDAVYGDTDGFNGPLLAGWTPLAYPGPGHPFEGVSMDLSFVITPEPATLSLLALGGLAVIRRRRAL